MVVSDEWRERAQCRIEGVPVDVFFPERGENEKVELAFRVCARCEVRLECAEFALREGIRFGIWGGLSGRVFREIRTEPDLTRRQILTRQKVQVKPHNDRYRRNRRSRTS